MKCHCASLFSSVIWAENDHGKLWWRQNEVIRGWLNLAPALPDDKFSIKWLLLVLGAEKQQHGLRARDRWDNFLGSLVMSPPMKLWGTYSSSPHFKFEDIKARSHGHTISQCQAQALQFQKIPSERDSQWLMPTVRLQFLPRKPE